MPALLVATSQDENAAGGDIVTAEPPTLNVGDILFAWMQNYWSGGTAATPGDITGITTRLTNSGTARFRDIVGLRVADGTEGPNYTSSIGGSTEYSLGELFQVIDAAGDTLDGSNTSTGTGSSASLPAVTTTAARCVAVAFVSTESFAISDVPSGWFLWREISGAGMRVYVRFIDAPNTSTGTATVSFAGSTLYAIEVITFAPKDGLRWPSPCGLVTEVGTSLGSTNAQPTFAAPGRAATAGDLAIYFIGNDNTGGTALSVSTDWTLIDNTVFTGNIIQSAWALRILDGGANDTLSVTGAAQDYCVAGLIIPKDMHSCSNVADLVHAVTTGTTSATPDPPSVSAPNNSLVLVACCVDMTTGNAITGVPTNYARLTALGTAGLKSANSTSSVGIAVACRPIAVAASENPGTFACNSQQWNAHSLVIPGDFPPRDRVRIMSQAVHQSHNW